MVYGRFIPLTPIKLSLLLKIDTFYSFIVTNIAMLQNIHQTSAKTSTIVYRLVVRSLRSVDRVNVKGIITVLRAISITGCTVKPVEGLLPVLIRHTSSSFFPSGWVN